MKIKEIILSIVMLIIGAFATYLFEINKSNNDNKKRFIEYELLKDNSVFSKPDITNKQIAILLDGKPVEQLSKLTIPLYNIVNNTDLKDLKIYFELYFPNGDSIKLVNLTARRQNNISDGFEIINELNPQVEKGGIKKGYSISSLNRTENSKPSFVTDFYFEGNKIPECKVFIDQPNVIDQPGVEARLYDYSNFIAWYDSNWGAILIFVGITILYFFMIFITGRLISFLSKRNSNKRKVEKVNFIMDQLKTNSNINALTRHEDLVEEILYLEARLQWKKMMPLTKFLYNYKEPKKPNA